MPLNESIYNAKERGVRTSCRLAVSMLGLRVVLPSLVAILFLFLSAARADSVSAFMPGTGYIVCIGYATQSLCPDVGITDISPGPAGNDIINENLNGYSGFTPTNGTWDTTGADDQEYGGCQYTQNCPVFDWRIYFNVLPPGPAVVTITGVIAANGPVAAAVDGVGAYLGDFTTAGPLPFTLTVNVNNTSIQGVTCDATECRNYIDYIFTGCTDWPSCSAPYTGPPGTLLEPVSELYVDPSFTTALPGATIDDIPESTLLATGGVGPVSPVATPEPGGLLLLGTVVLVLLGARTYKRLHAKPGGADPKGNFVCPHS
jgi:hypothetical protein